MTGDVAAFECKAGSTLEVLTCLGTRQRKGRNTKQEAASDVPSHSSDCSYTNNTLLTHGDAVAFGSCREVLACPEETDSESSEMAL